MGIKRKKEFLLEMRNILKQDSILYQFHEYANG